MNEEEKKAIGVLKALNNLGKKCKIEKVPYNSKIKKIRISLLPEDYGIFEILLNLIEKLQKENAELKNELKEKDKIIDLIAERVFLTEKEWEHMKKRRFLRNDFDLKKEIKNYFENIAKGE